MNCVCNTCKLQPMQTFILIFKAEANVPYTFPIQLTNSRSIIGATSFFVMNYCVYTTQW